MSALPVLLAAIAGAIVGSFIATLCLRWPQGVQVVTGRSRCDSCGTVLGPRELVPVVSAAAAGGRCRTCAAPIDPLHPQVEIAAALAGCVAVLLAPGAQGALLAIFFWLLLPIAVLDARHFWLPDRLTILLGLAGLVAGGPLFGIALGDRLAGAAAGFASLALVALAYRKLRGVDGMGAGDPKLIAAIGLWTGWQSLPAILLLASLAGLAAALAAGGKRLDRLPLGTLLCWGAAVWGVLRLSGAWPALPLG